MTKTKPDYVFNVWGDGRVLEDPCVGASAKDHRLFNEFEKRWDRVTHRILVRLKNKEDKE